MTIPQPEMHEARDLPSAVIDRALAAFHACDVDSDDRATTNYDRMRAALQAAITFRGLLITGTPRFTPEYQVRAMMASLDPFDRAVAVLELERRDRQERQARERMIVAAGARQARALRIAAGGDW